MGYSDKMKERYCEKCEEKMLCRSYLGLKTLDEYDDTDNTPKYKNNWRPGVPIIATVTRNPVLGLEIDTNVTWVTIPIVKQNLIERWAKEKGEKRLRKIVDNVGVTKTFDS